MKPHTPVANGHPVESNGPILALSIPQLPSESKKKSQKKRSSYPPAEQALVALQPHITAPSGDVPSLVLNVNDFASAFTGLRESLQSPGPRPATGNVRRKKLSDAVSDDVPSVVERSTLLSTFVFHQADVSALMKSVMPVQTSVSAEAAALVTQAMCHFVALITAEAEDGIHPFDDDTEPVEGETKTQQSPH